MLINSHKLNQLNEQYLPYLQVGNLQSLVKAKTIKDIIIESGKLIETISAERKFPKNSSNTIITKISPLITANVMDEIEFLDNIRNQKEFMNIPVLLISNDKSKEHYLEVLKHGAIDMIVHRKDLRTTIHRLISELTKNSVN